LLKAVLYYELCGVNEMVCHVAVPSVGAYTIIHAYNCSSADAILNLNLSVLNDNHFHSLVYFLSHPHNHNCCHCLASSLLVDYH